MRSEGSAAREATTVCVKLGGGCGSPRRARSSATTWTPQLSRREAARSSRSAYDTAAVTPRPRTAGAVAVGSL